MKTNKEGFGVSLVFSLRYSKIDGRGERWRKVKEVDDDVDINADADANVDAEVAAAAAAAAAVDDDDDDDVVVNVTVCSIVQRRTRPRRSAGRLTRLRANITYVFVSARSASA